MSDKLKIAIETLASVKMAILLMLILAVVSVFGTFRLPDGRYDLFYQTIYFRLLVGALCLNLIFCTLRSIHSLLNKYREKRIDSWRRKVVASSGTTLIHCAILIGTLGGLAGDLGFVGTMILPEGVVSNLYFDWRQQEDKELPFELRLDQFAIDYYPVEMKVELARVDSPEALAVYHIKEGEVLDAPIAGVRLTAKHFDPREHTLTFTMDTDRTDGAEYQALPRSKGVNELLNTGFYLRPVAFGKPKVKQLRAKISVVEKDEVRNSKIVKVNEPLNYAGVSVYLTTYAIDEFGFWQVGLQLSKNPGEPIVLFACVMFLIGMTLVLLAKVLIR